MFARESNASKFALIAYAELLAQEGVTLIDCQVANPHLMSPGAEMVGREDFFEGAGEIGNCCEPYFRYAELVLSRQLLFCRFNY